jgi:hypothetical protein
MARPSHQWDTSGVKHMKIEEEQTLPSNLPAILQAMEVERYVEELKSFKLEEVGSKAWMEQHRVIEKLNLQAHQNAMTNSDEYVMEAFLTFNKLHVLIHDLLVIEAWKTHVYPLLVDDLAGKNNMRLYFILYHEATVVNLFEVFFYYKHVCESVGEKMIELADYIARKLARLNDPSYNFRECDISTLSPTGASATPEDASAAAKQLAANLESRKPAEELQQHWTEIEFRTSIACVGLARFLSEHAEVLPLSTVSRITDTHDYLMMIIPLIENPPWTRRLDNGKWQKLIDQKWQYVVPIDLLKITKLEGQPWIALYQLLGKEVFRERYYLNSFRKGQLLRVRKYINDLVLDQLPFLADVQRYMDELAITNVPEPSSLSGQNVFLFQQVATLRESIVKGKNFAEIAEYQKREVFTMTDRDDKDLFAMAELYSDDAIEQVLDGGLSLNDTTEDGKE